MDLSDDTPRAPSTTVVESLERSQADLAAGRTVPLEPFLARMHEKIRCWEASQEERAVDGSRR